MLKVRDIKSVQDPQSSCERPVMINTIKAGFPSPAAHEYGESLDLNNYLIQRPESTFFIRVSGESMTDVGIFSGDLLIVDRSIQAQHRQIVIAIVDEEFVVKRLYKKEGNIKLQSENKLYPDIDVKNDLVIWGVVTYTIHKPQ